MSPVLANCPLHGVFEDNFLISFDAPNSEAKVGVSNSVVPCPQCGQPSAVIDGKYTFHRDGSYSAVLRPTPAQLRRLQTVAHWAMRKVEEEPDRAEVVAAKVESTIRREWAGVGPILDALGSKRATTAATWLGILIALISLLVSTNTNSIGPEELATILEQAEEHRIPSDDNPAPPSPDVVPLGDHRSGDTQDS